MKALFFSRVERKYSRMIGIRRTIWNSKIKANVKPSIDVQFRSQDKEIAHYEGHVIYYNGEHARMVSVSAAETLNLEL